MGRRSEKPIGENEEDVSTAGRSQRNESKRKSLKDESEDTDEDVETPARKRTSAKNRDRKEVENDDELSDPDDDNEENEEPVPKKSQRKKKETKETNNEDQEYDVEKIVGDRAIKGRIQYKIRWKGYESEDDTWENESTLDCNELIEEYNDAKGDDDVIAKRSPGAKTKADRRSASTSSSTKKEKSVSERKKAMASQHSGNAPDSDGEWEVSKLIDMHTNKNGSREFLVRWKGFPPEDDSWEPEEHLKGTEILERFLKKVEQARAASEKELRVRRKPTDFYAPTTFQKQGGVRASKRFTHRERAKYYDAD